MRLKTKIIKPLFVSVLVFTFSGGSLVSADSQSSENDVKVGWAGIGAFNLAVKQDGTVWAWSGNSDSRPTSNLEDADNPAIIKVPKQVKGISDVTAVASGHGFSLALKKDGTVWGWGGNGDGQLGDGTQSVFDLKTYETIKSADKDIPVQAKGLSNVVAIAADWNTSYAVKNDGTLWAWGGIYYRKADGSVANYIVPTQLKKFSDIASVSLGWGNMVALKKDGTVWIPSHGNVVQVDGLSDIIEIAAGGQYSYGLKKDGKVWFWGSNGESGAVVGGKDTADHSKPQLLEGIEDVVSVQASAGGPLLLKSDGTVWASGTNTGGQLGIGSYEDSIVPVQVKGLTRIKKIAASGTEFKSMAIKADHTLWSWGNGYVGDGTKWYRTVPVWIKSYDSEVLQEDQIMVNLDNKELEFDQPPTIVKGHTMVPLRKIFEELGADIQWDKDTLTATATKGQTIIKLTVGSNVAYINGVSTILDSEPLIIEGRTLVPARFIVESFGAKVSWEENSKTVFIKTK
ncbi:hypothetical protein HZF08_06175 [Paenibacillus sp. CGMCC 1.16610]|uniref:Copper amine oxidase-like N-terminal domain-containing protein n=1 Tax=Paenibacillus anseongense TaxID=2682845 RepID=A0ABW9UCH5_9BACL|nr:MULTISPECIES: stalk domain-containing protein [Paenibacillus]MBA2937886.1 hypothetical protein [Paenibacillus sp. CGMCC 1.16610]MVQ36944.1 hypothetical protein [Paenibacillus anseongense]